MSKEKPKLRDAVRLDLENRQQTQRSFAESSFLDYDDFRMQLVRNSFSQAALESIATLLREPDPELLKNTYEFSFLKKTKNQTISGVEIVRDRIRHWFRADEDVDLVLNLKTLYEKLQKDDLVAVCTLNEPPVECSWTGWNTLGDLYVEAVKNGATFLYIRPEHSLLTSYPKHLVNQFFGSVSPEDEIHDLRTEVLKKGRGIDESEAKARIRLYTTKLCPFWMIGIRLGFYSILNSDGSRKTALFARFPFGGSLSGDSDDGNIILLTNNKICEAFQIYLADCFSREKALADLLPTLRSKD